jgi:hypothetical protein
LRLQPWATRHSHATSEIIAPPLVIIIDNTHSTGLQERVTDGMIQVNKEQQTGKG